MDPDKSSLCLEDAVEKGELAWFDLRFESKNQTNQLFGLKGMALLSECTR